MYSSFDCPAPRSCGLLQLLDGGQRAGPSHEVRWDLKRKIDLDWLFEYSDIDLLCFPRPKIGSFF